ncbi:MAG: anti-sigma F factor [Anaeroplasma sp.]|nr:anti-sigma F factor [Anaeroplasma sp.]
MKNEIKLSILSDKKNISIIRNIIGCILIDYNPTVSFINEIKTVLSEAVTNCIVHAYESMPDKWIDINIGISIEKVSLEVIDKGIGIENVDLAKEALYSTKKDEERSGLGFTIMELFCDKLVVESKVNEGTRVYLEKKW